VEREWGRIDVLANVAGITQPIKVANTTVEDWDRITGVNM
jgi:NAD(P)-dependent dehydrogenase (short-subunit alcohol dehydrogenase family)